MNLRKRAIVWVRVMADRDIEGIEMATKLEANVVVNRPIEHVFAFLAAPENHTKFVPGLLEFKQTSPGPLWQVGAQIQGVRRLLGRRTSIRYELAEYEPNKKLGLMAFMGPSRFKGTYLLDPVRDATKVTFSLEFEIRGLMRLAQRFLVRMGKTSGTESLDNLKRMLENVGTSAR